MDLSCYKFIKKNADNEFDRQLWDFRILWLFLKPVRWSNNMLYICKNVNRAEHLYTLAYQNVLCRIIISICPLLQSFLLSTFAYWHCHCIIMPSSTTKTSNHSGFEVIINSDKLNYFCSTCSLNEHYSFTTCCIVHSSFWCSTSKRSIGSYLSYCRLQLKPSAKH